MFVSPGEIFSNPTHAMAKRRRSLARPFFIRKLFDDFPEDTSSHTIRGKVNVEGIHRLPFTQGVLDG